MNKRKAALAIPDKDREQLEAITRSRIESASRVQRAKILLMYAKGEKIINITRQLSTTRPLVYRAIDKALTYSGQVKLDLQAYVLFCKYEKESIILL